jgi:Saccharopine dehydrogenase NADP binding domain
MSLDVNDTPALEAAVAAVDVVVSLIPYTLHVPVIEAAIKSKTHVVTTSYVSPAVRALEERVKAAGVVVINEIGLDPGIDHLYAVKTIDEVHAQGGKVLSSLLPRMNPSKQMPCSCSRSSNSTPIAAAFLRQRQLTTHWGTNFLGLRVVYSLPCSTQPLGLPTARYVV